MVFVICSKRSSLTNLGVFLHKISDLFCVQPISIIAIRITFMKNSLLTRRFVSILGAILALQLLGLSGLQAEKLTLLGFWNFDESRRADYIRSVKIQQANNQLGEIAAQMGMGKIENSSYEFGFDAGTKKPYLKIVDKTTKKIQTSYLDVEVTPEKELIMTDVETGNTFRVKPKNNDQMTLIDNAKKLTIPLRRIND